VGFDGGAMTDEIATLPVAREAAVARRRSDGGRELTDSRGTGVVLGELTAAARPRIAEILRASRVFSGDEIAVALELFDEAHEERGLRTEESVSPQSSVLVPHSPSDYLFLGAFSPEGILVGYACWGPTPATDRTWDLYWIAVDPMLHGAGIGTILLEEVERRLVKRHARMLVVETSSRSDYTATRAFYGRRGYAVAASVRDFYAPGDDRIIFVKRFHSLAEGRGAESP
jgi:ribosomal protein S18 acetylase RimI-like enzyme